MSLSAASTGVGQDADKASSSLVVRDLRVSFSGRGGEVVAVAGVSFVVEPGRTLGIVGESGSGKSVTAKAIMGLLGTTAAVSGSVRIDGDELLGLPEKRLRLYRGAQLAMVFQDPMRSLNPTMRVGAQVAEAVRLHRNLPRRAAWDEAVSLLAAVRVADPERRAHEYPHQLSGGMRQRVVIAMALSARPTVLIADEPTTALDVTTQAQILDLLDELKARYNMGVILITHDLAIAACHTDRIAVMYAGKVVEAAPTATIFGAIRMPYTKALFDAIPTMDQPPHSLLASVEGNPPDLADMPPGCSFAPRCPKALDRCRVESPALVVGEPDHSWACWYPLGVRS